ncbi:MAG: ABC transporter ATP-binding protein [Rhodospirillaceae bacterium]|nr:ABC transporter ATP-binding protein [Rhodospirillaceae bacterium]
MSVLEVDRLTVALPMVAGLARAVRDVSFRLERGETLGIVGESGCGKSMMALALMGLLPEGADLRGGITLNGCDLRALDEKAMCRVRGNAIAMVFQEPMTSLNPVHTIGKQVIEPLMLHFGLGRDEANAETLSLLERVGLVDPRRFYGAYPHQLSGGQRQRAMIAMALSCHPEVLIADEPTTALDVTIQGQILDLIRDVVSERQMSLILISHDLGVIAETVDRVFVMYGGAVVEQGPTPDVFARLAHPYTQGLFAAVPQVGEGRRRLRTIPGTVPELADLPGGCTFADRCSLAHETCRSQVPDMRSVGENHSAACLRLDAAMASSSFGSRR